MPLASACVLSFRLCFSALLHAAVRRARPAHRPGRWSGQVVQARGGSAGLVWAVAAVRLRLVDGLGTHIWQVWDWDLLTRNDLVGTAHVDKHDILSLFCNPNPEDLDLTLPLLDAHGKAVVGHDGHDSQLSISLKVARKVAGLQKEVAVTRLRLCLRLSKTLCVASRVCCARLKAVTCLTLRHA